MHGAFSTEHVHDAILREDQRVVAESTEEKLGWALVYIRALENRNFGRASQAVNCYNDLATCGKLVFQSCMSLNEHELGKHIGAVRDLAVSLAREDINDDLVELQRTRGTREQDEPVKSKESILRKLKRLSPGEATSICCVVDDAGDYHSSPEAMARVHHF